MHYGILSDRRPGKTENKFAAENEADAMAAENSYDYIFKVLFLGESGSGKNSMVFRLASFETNNEIISTIGKKSVVDIGISKPCFSANASVTVDSRG